MTQYSKRMVIIHWLTLLLLVVAWFLGSSLADATDESKATLAGYVAHLSAGGAILLLTMVRFYSRHKDGIPAPIGDTSMDKLAKGVHHLLYALLFLLPVSGITIILTSKAGAALFAGDASLLPKEHDYDHVFAHSVHELLVTVLIVLVVVHLLGAIKHQFILKDGLLNRMSLRNRN